ncbi:RodZ family helix-turn-helix domain-containing protein [Pseudostreptobacillus hongkongensis]|uniref:helix-turn-helix domain-containing protein n=1 Tax=Pseudostreptobacillus hongkongensis TaxID=1162717 RepID=UPI00082A5F35|nr:helix-turn-helix transcriptional regulator [Pseudostreptobacillus hongkongensis]
MELGQTLKIARERKGYSLREVEAKLNERGVSYAHTNIKRIEDDENTKAPIKVLATLSEVYGLDKINILNLAGANIEEKAEYDDVVKKSALFFNNENVSEEDKKKLLEVLSEMFYEAKFGK